MSEKITVQIPVGLYKAAEDILLQTEDVKDPSDAVCRILKEFVPDYQDSSYSEAEQKEIGKRLQDLGYLG